jgi:predicted DNA-binding transcriptional regulator AlpA
MASPRPDGLLTPAFIGPGQLAHWLGCSISLIYHLTSSKRLPYYHLGDGPKPRLRFDPQEIRAWLDEHKSHESDIAARLRRRS